MVGLVTPPARPPASASQHARRADRLTLIIHCSARCRPLLLLLPLLLVQEHEQCQGDGRLHRAGDARAVAGRCDRDFGVVGPCSYRA